MADKNIFANQGPTKPDVPRSMFDLSHANNLTARFGRLTPCFLYDAPAGSSFEITARQAFDLAPMTFEIQTPIRSHVKFYKVPKRILWENYKDFIGGHGDHVIPYVQRTDYWHPTGSLADYMGIPSVKISETVERRGAMTSGVFRTSKLNEMVAGRYRAFDALFDTSAVPTSATRKNVMIAKINAPLKVGEEIYLDLITTATVSTSTTEQIGITLANFGYDSTVVREPHHGSSEVIAEFDGVHYRFLTSRLALTRATAAADGKWRFVSSNVSVNIGGLACYQSRIGIKVTADMATASVKEQAGRQQCIIFDWQTDLWGNPFVNRPHTTMKVDSVLSQTAQACTSEVCRTVSSVPQYGFDPLIEYPRIVYLGDNVASASPFVSQGGAAPKLPINVLPFRAYEFIYRYFYNNERITPFIKDGHETFNEYLTNKGDGADSTTPLDFFRVPWEYDLFTTCVKTPQFGPAPLVGITYSDGDAKGTLHMVPDGGTPYNIGVSVDENANIIGISNYDDIADHPGTQRLQEAIDFGISINDFRNVNCLQRWAERMLKAGTKYENIIFEFFGTHPNIGEEYPTYLGGVTSDVMVSKITNTAMTDNGVLGETAGQGSIRGRSKEIRCFCAEECYIVGLVYFTVTPVLPQMLPRLFTKTNLLEFANPQFTMVSPQPVYTHQLAPLQLTDAQLFDVLGYNRAFADYVSMQDEVHGDFRETMSNFLLQRIFATKPELNEDFIYIKPEDLTNIFSVLTDTDKIHGQIYFVVHAKLPLPRFAVPRII